VQLSYGGTAMTSDLEPIFTHIARQLDELIVIHTRILESLQVMINDQSQPHQREARYTKLRQEIANEAERRRQEPQ
jgi:hypothetical protein